MTLPIPGFVTHFVQPLTVQGKLPQHRETGFPAKSVPRRSLPAAATANVSVDCLVQLSKWQARFSPNEQNPRQPAPIQPNALSKGSHSDIPALMGPVC